jgi:protein transport protein SEC13
MQRHAAKAAHQPLERQRTCPVPRVQVFELAGEQATPVADLRGHEGPVWQVAWAHPKFGQMLASCSFDHRVIIWKEVTEGQWTQVGAGGSRC